MTQKPQKTSLTVDGVNPSPEALLKTHEVARWLGVSSQWVLDWVPGFTLDSGAARYKPSEVEEWLEKRKRNGQERKLTVVK